MIYCTILVSIIAATLLIALLHYRMQVKKNCRQLEVMQKHTSNQRLTCEVPYKEVNELIQRINDICNRYQEDRIVMERNENNLKEAIANLSHDIRTPLTSLDGYVQLLVMSENPEEKEHYLQIIQNRISSLKELLEELFTYTKMQDQNYALAVVPMDGAQCICETVLAFYEDFEKRGLTPDVNFCEEELPIVANEVALRRVVQNIVKNALVHGVSKIGLSLEKEDGQLHFSCYNDKKPDEVIDVEQIFERFYKGDKARTSTSTGLGLAIAKGLVERMKGTISAEVKDEMFVLDIRLPLSEKPVHEKERIVEKDH